MMGRHSSVGIATCFRLDGQEIESGCGRDVPHPSSLGPGAPPSLCGRGTGPLPRGKSGRGLALPPPPPLAKKVNQSHYRPEVPRGFQEVKVPGLRDNGPEWWYGCQLYAPAAFYLPANTPATRFY